jgi:hypothetical protein
MRAMKRTAIVAVLFLSACGSSPIAPAPAPTPVPLAQPSFAALSETLDITCPPGGCIYSFQATNKGPGCGKAVKGTVTLFNVTGAQVANDAWAIDGAKVVRAGESFTVTDCCVAEVDAKATTAVKITFESEAVACQ